MSTVRYYRHDDVGAPTLTGEVGSLTNLLRKCLVGTAGVAYGSKPSAGWTEEFAGAASNIAVFRNSQSEGGCGCYVRVHDNAPGTGGARESQINVYNAMTDVNTGTLGTAATYFRKSSTLSTTARPWAVIADGLTAWVYSWLTGDGTNYGHNNSLHGFGDFATLESPANTNRYFVLGRQTQNSAQGGNMEVFRSARVASPTLQVARPDGLAAPAQPAYWHYNAAATYGGAGFAASYAGDVLLTTNLPVFDAAGTYFGYPRGLVIPYTQLYTLSPTDPVPGAAGIVVVKGNGNGGATDIAQFAVGIDSVGPW